MLTNDPSDPPEEELITTLRSAFRNATAELEADPGLSLETLRHRRSRRPRPAPLAMVAVGVAAIVVATVLLWPAGKQQAVQTAGQPAPPPPTGPALAATGPALAQPAPNSWEALPTATAEARVEGAYVWTGTQLLEMGGTGASRNEQGFADGISFEPAHSSWGSIPRSPLGVISAASAVWTGTEMIVLAGPATGPTPPPGSGTPGAAYNPQTRTWRRIATFPWGDPISAVWTGSRLLVWDWYDAVNSGVVSRTALYDPASNTWTEGSPEPGSGLSGQAVWDGSELIALGTPEKNLGHATEQMLRQPLQGAAYDPASDAWHLLPAPPLPGYRTSWIEAWTGTELVVGGGQDATGTSLSDAAAYNPATGTWSSLPAAPIGFTGSMVAAESAIWTGSAVLTLNDEDPAGRPLLYSPSTNAWTVAATEPLPGLKEAATVWTGSDLLIWAGGQTQWNADRSFSECCTPQPGGWAFAPPA